MKSISTNMIRLFLLASILLCNILMVAQERETTKPLIGIEIERKVALLDIEGEIYYDVIMTFKSNYDFFPTVKVTVTDSEGKKIWKKTLKNVYLYVFSDGQIQVGKQNFVMIVVNKSKERGEIIGQIKEKEGVYYTY